MKSRTLPSLAFLSIALIFSGCSLFSKYGEIEYNNLIVEKINATSLAIEETATIYNETLPEVVTEKDTFDITEMQNSYNDAIEYLAEINTLLTLESRNTEQQNAVRTEIQTYTSAGNLYLQSYSEMLTYFGTTAYQEDITQVKPMDETLHLNYTTFIESNNDLVDTLDSFLNLTTDENE